MQPQIDEQWAKKRLEPVLFNLQQTNQDKPEILNLLKHIQLDIGPHFSLNPNAYAFRDGSHDVVKVDLSKIVYGVATADFAALLHANPKNAQEIGLLVGKEYGELIKAFQGNGRPMPDFIVTIDGYIQDTEHRQRVKESASFIHEAFIAWMVLHEVGHHILGHTNRRPRNNVESRSDESDADTWAFEAMNSSRYSLNSLEKFLFMEVLAEMMRQQFQFAPPTTHPSWDQRLKDLQRFMATHHPSQDPYVLWQRSGFSYQPGMPAQYLTLILMVPNKDNTLQGQRIASFMNNWIDQGTLPFMLATEYRDGKVFLYHRTPGRTMNITIATPERFSSDVEIREFINGREVTGVVNMERAFVGHYYVAENNKSSLATLMQQGTPADWEVQALYKVERSLSVANIAERRLTEIRIKNGELFLAVMKGTLSREEYEKQWRTNLETVQKELQSLLGPQKYSQYEAAVRENSFLKEAQEQVQRRLPPALR